MNERSGDQDDDSQVSSPRGSQLGSPRIGSPQGQRSPRSPQNVSGGGIPSSSAGNRVVSAAQRQAQNQAAIEARRQQLDANFTNYAGPSWDPNIDDDDRTEALQREVLSDVNKSLLSDFRSKIYKPTMSTCSRCKERWFDKNIIKGVCGDC